VTGASSAPSRASAVTAEERRWDSLREALALVIGEFPLAVETLRSIVQRALKHELQPSTRLHAPS